MRIEGFLPYRLAVVAEALSRQLGAVYGGEHGLTREEWRLLFLIEDAGRIDSLQLAGRTSLDKVQVSRAASRASSAKELVLDCALRLPSTSSSASTLVSSARVTTTPVETV